MSRRQCSWTPHERRPGRPGRTGSSGPPARPPPCEGPDVTVRSVAPAPVVTLRQIRGRPGPGPAGASPQQDRRWPVRGICYDEGWLRTLPEYRGRQHCTTSLQRQRVGLEGSSGRRKPPPHGQTPPALADASRHVATRGGKALRIAGPQEPQHGLPGHEVMDRGERWPPVVPVITATVIISEVRSQGRSTAGSKPPDRSSRPSRGGTRRLISRCIRIPRRSSPAPGSALRTGTRPRSDSLRLCSGQFGSRRLTTCRNGRCQCAPLQCPHGP
ncbi:hypothetical protein P3T39_003450 [Kitasatospora sp. GP82]|nr:hypothetical protein [Kitasatospora sp. GP82]